MTLDSLPQRILIIRPSALGDVCRSVGMLASLRKANPGASIAWVVQDDFAPAIEAHPALNEVIGFPRKPFADWWKSARSFGNAWQWLKQLRRRQFDLVLDCQGLARSGLMTWMTGAPERVGLRRAREFGWLGYTIRAPRNRTTPFPQHAVDQMFLLIEELGIEVVRDMRLYVTPAHQQWWSRTREESNIGGPYAVLAPTSRWPSKRWPMDRFAQLIEPLLMRGFARVVVIGAPSEAEQVRGLFAGVSSTGPLVNFVGQTGVGQTMAMIAEAGMVIANDSAPLHMAVGFDRPCVGLYGPTDPAVVGPYQREDSVVRGYHARAGESINYKDPKLGESLMRLISHVAVVQAIDRQLARRAEFSSRHQDAEPPATARAAS